MGNRWKMNRMGFVNFWLYDDEVFPLEDGKILLRGQNASGKSIATQSFIPFILDGDRTPRRLDPFGSKDRRMEYYFLGDGEREESTGYLFLEFQKADTQRYRTLVIGQRARKGHPMDFWGFVLLDGRRVGYDLLLYRQVGSSKVPLSKQEMKKELGEQVPFTDAQKEYKEMVNRYLFGFPRIDQYEQFIQLLIKVRAPKLSNAFKPGTVYSILNESLQTLRDEELRTMVDAMEKMDSIQGELEDLRGALAETRMIRNEYIRYNQYMLARKGETYLHAETEAERAHKRLEADDQMLEDNRAKLRQLEEEVKNFIEQRQLAEAELEALGDVSLEEAAERLNRAKAEKDELSKEIGQCEQLVEQSRDACKAYQYEVKDKDNFISEQQSVLAEEKERFCFLQEDGCVSVHQQVMEMIDGETIGKNQIYGALKEQRENVARGIEALENQERCEHQYDQALEKLEQQNRQVISLENDLNDLLDIAEQLREDYIETVYHSAQEHDEFILSETQIRQIEALLQAFQGEKEERDIKAVLESAYSDASRRLQKELLSAEAEENRSESELKRRKAELEELRNSREIEPERKAKIEESRRLLSNAQIQYIPFYRAVEFASDLDAQTCSNLEAQLEAAGILDALIIGDEGQQQLETGDLLWTDTYLWAEDYGAGDFCALSVSDGITPALQEATRKVLSHFYVEGEGKLRLSSDGTFGGGLLAGRAEGTGEAEYVGTLARQRKKAAAMEKLEREIEELRQLRNQAAASVENLSVRLQVLEKEFRQLCDFGLLRNKLEDADKLRWKLNQAEQLQAALTEEEQKLLAAKKQAFQQVLAHCRTLPYSRSTDAYRRAQVALDGYMACWDDCQRTLGHLQHLELERSNLEERIEREEEKIDGQLIQIRRFRKSVEKLEIEIREKEEFLSRPENQERAKRTVHLKDVIGEMNEGLQQAGRRQAVLENEVQRLVGERQEKVRNAEDAERALSLHGEIFQEELALGLVIAREGRSLHACAQMAAERLRGQDKNRDVSELITAFMQVFEKNRSTLIPYGARLEPCFKDQSDAENAEMSTGSAVLRSRLVFRATMNGKHMDMEEFFNLLKEKIQVTESLIQVKDRELFEDILSNTLSRQLTDRIAESRNWVEDMSALMQRMDTSMGLSFALEWKPISAESEDQMDTLELEKLLLRDRALLSAEDIQRVATHFRSKISKERQQAEENGDPVNYMDMVRDALDYRKWFSFQMYYRRSGENRKVLTDAAFNRFSGGEKAMAMYVPLLTALNAQYQKAEQEDHPRLMAMDEAFAGVDDKNISSMFALVEQMDFDYILNSQVLWGCHETVPALHITELHKPGNAKIVTTIHYTWNGHERILDVY